MKVSTRGRYALRCILNLAVHGAEDSISISRISQQEEISHNYIEQLFLKLKKKGLVKSLRGRRGGYALTRNPENISIAEVLEAVEGPIVTVDCVEKGCRRYDICTTRHLWEILSEKIRQMLATTTLKDLCDITRNKMTEDLRHKLVFNI